MDRLTVPDERIDGGLRRAIIDAREVRKEAMTIYWRLKKYEDTGLTPEDIEDGRMFPCWIPVSERLPETNRQVLVQWELSSRIYNTVSVYTELMRWNGEMWISDKGVPVGQTVAWMPLPEPYRTQSGKE